MNISRVSKRWLVYINTLKIYVLTHKQYQHTDIYVPIYNHKYITCVNIQTHKYRHMCINTLTRIYQHIKNICINTLKISTHRRICTKTYTRTHTCRKTVGTQKTFHTSRVRCIEILRAFFTCDSLQLHCAYVCMRARALSEEVMQHTATQCTTHCNTLQLTKMLCNTLQHTAAHYIIKNALVHFPTRLLCCQLSYVVQTLTQRTQTLLNHGCCRNRRTLTE